MNHAVNVRMRLENLVKILLFPDVNIVVFRSLAAYELDTIDRLLRRIVQIVYDHDLVVCFEQSKSCKRSNVAAATAKVLAFVFGNEKFTTHPVTSTEPTVMFYDILVRLFAGQLVFLRAY